MENSSLLFMKCDELREEFNKCANDANKRMLIIDVRKPSLYERSHLCLDKRNDIGAIKTKMRVMNIDPDLLKVCTIKNIMSILSPNDLRVFEKRRDATEVIVIDKNTDNIQQLTNPKSKVTRLINGLTRFDNQIENKITAPIYILQGGFRDWLTKYPHFTTDSTFDPYNDDDDHEMEVSPIDPTLMPTAPPISLTIPSSNHIMKPIVENGHNIVSPTNFQPTLPTSPKPSAHQFVAKPPAITKQIPKTPVKLTSTISNPLPPQLPPPTIVKNAPGTAVPIAPSMHLTLRPALPRSHSSPNVAQAEGDDLENLTDHLNNFTLTEAKNDHLSVNVNNNHINAHQTVISASKPRFDRALKPAFNNEAINSIRAQLNFGRSPEASVKTISGLQNLGNTCFMNSVIQCLAYIPSLESYFCSDNYYSHINFNSQYGSKGELSVEFGSLVEKLNLQRYRYIEPRSFRDAVTKHVGFAGNEQQDSHEFMMMLFDKLHHDLNINAKDKLKTNGITNGSSNNDDSNINISRTTLAYQFWKRHLELNRSIISDLFEGIFMSTLTCTFCKGQSNTFEVFNCLSLPIPSETRCHLKDCLNHFSNPERIDATWECPRCKQKREADKKIVICKLPKILIIHLKRFSLDGKWRSKLQTTVDFPLRDLNVDCTSVLPQSAHNPKSTYNLCAVVNHYGHLDGGHYTAFCRLGMRNWYTFDDSNVSEMNDADVCGQSAYILFYGAAGV